MTTVLKLGGSLITEKDRLETVDEKALERAVRAIAACDIGELVLVHGGGSFGHPAASEHGVSSACGTHETEAIRAIHAAMERLDEVVLDALVGAGLPALPVSVLSIARRERDGTPEIAVGAIEAMLAEGFVPVLYGDVVISAGRGATVLGGDESVVSLAGELDADRVGLCSTVPGVLDDSGQVIERIESFQAVADALEGSDATDVTGGMKGKVGRLLELDAPASVFGIEELEAFLDGKSAGTRIE